MKLRICWTLLIFQPFWGLFTVFLPPNFTDNREFTVWGYAIVSWVSSRYHWFHAGTENQEGTSVPVLSVPLTVLGIKFSSFGSDLGSRYKCRISVMFGLQTICFFWFVGGGDCLKGPIFMFTATGTKRLDRF